MQNEQPYHNKVNLIRSDTSEDFAEVYDGRKLLKGLKRHLNLIVFCTLLFGCLGVFVTYKLVKTHLATSILVYHEDPSTKTIPGGYPINTPSLATSLDMIMMPKNFEAVKSILGLELSPSEIMNMVTIPVASSDSKLKRIEVRSTNPHLATDVANVLAKVVVKNNQDFTREQLRVALEIYRNELVNTNVVLNKQNEQIEEFKKEHQYFETDPNYVQALADIDSSKRALSNVDLNYQGLLVEYENLKREAQLIPDKVPINRDTRDSPYKVRIMTLETALAEAKAKYTPENPKILSMEEELKELFSKMKSATDENQPDEYLEKNPVKETIALELMHMQGKVRSAQKTKEELTAQVAESEKRLQKVPAQQIQLQKLLLAKQATEDQIKFLKNTIDSTQLLMNTPTGSIELYASAKDAGSSNDKLWVNLIPAVGILIGLFFGLFLAGLLEVIDPYIRTSKQINMYYTTPCLLTIPEISRLSLKNGEKKMHFYIRDLAGKIERLMPKGKGHAITLTSSKNSEGKSLIAFYLANYFRAEGKKVVVLEFDQTLNSLISSPSHTLKELMDNPSLITETMTHVRISDNHTSLKSALKSEAFSNFWAKFKSDFDYVIIEAPGLIKENFAIDLSHLSDLMFFVIGSSKTQKKCIDESLILLESFDVAPDGIILNRVNPIYIDDERIKMEMNRNGSFF